MFGFGSKPRVPAVVTGVTAPTTATAGQLGDIRFDTDGNRWELIGIIGGLYYWALPLDCFPVNNTEYIAYIKSNTVVYKYKFAYGTCPDNTTVSKPHNIANMTKLISVLPSFVLASTNLLILNGMSQSAIGSQFAVSASDTQVTVATGANRTAYNCFVVLKYIKT